MTQFFHSDYLFKTRLTRPDLIKTDRWNLAETFFSFVNVRWTIALVSNFIAGISSSKSGVGERLVQVVEVFKPESLVIIVITLGIDGHGEDRRRIGLISASIWLIAGVERDRFKHRHGNKPEVEWNNSESCRSNSEHETNWIEINQPKNEPRTEWNGQIPLVKF